MFGSERQKVRKISTINLSKENDHTIVLINIENRKIKIYHFFLLLARGSQLKNLHHRKRNDRNNINDAFALR